VTGDPAHFPFSIEALGKEHDRAAFSSGSQPLDAYFRTQARQDIEKRVAATFVLRDMETRRIAGFYSLSSTAIPLDKFPAEIAKRLPKYPLVPATLLARLAVDSDYRRRGLGEFLLLDALRRSLEHSREVASAALVVDAKDQAARTLCLKHRFLDFPDQSMRLFLPMKTIEKLF
jgi:GNAT superfamily N-acetyltransferase